MDRSACKAIVDREIEGLMLRFGIPHWKIVVGYEPESCVDADGYCTGRCVWLVDYNKARITLNPEAFDDEDEVLRVLRHELFHVVLAPTQIYVDAVKPVLKGNQALWEATESVRVHANEQAVIALERMYYGMTHHGQGTRFGDGPAPKADARPKRRRK